MWTAAHAVARVLLNPKCLVCGQGLSRPLSGPVCAACWGEVLSLTPPLCEQCGDALPTWRESAERCARCRRSAPAYSMARSAGRYEGALRAIVHAFKYRGCRYLATPLGRRVREGAADLLDGADAVVPVPLHPWRAFRRGFNQSDDLARQLGRPVWRPLVRVRLGPPQAGVPAARRHANVRGAFRTTPIGPLLALGHGWTRRLAGRSVVLVDDVMTTGATLDACARVLRAAGVSDVRAVTVARAAAARL